MMKFFRKYNKALLAVFMALLMIVFVGGQALESLLAPQRDPVIAESALGPIKVSDRRVADATTKMIAASSFNWKTPFGGEPIDIIDWILLTREAERYQTAVSPAAARVILGGEEGARRFRQLARQLRVKYEHVMAAVSEYLSVRGTASLVLSAAVPSEAEVRYAARMVLDKVKVGAVVLPAEAFKEDGYEPTDAEIEAQWSEYKDDERGYGLNFGYFVPVRVAVQYIKVDRDAISESIGVANIEKKAKHYFDEHRSSDPEFLRIGGGEEDSAYLDWEEAKDAAIRIVRREQADDAAANIANWLLQYDAEKWVGAEFVELEKGEYTGYRQPPEKVAELGYYEGILENMPKTIAYRDAVTVVKTDFFGQDEASKVPEIGRATYRPQSGYSWRTLRDLAFRSEAVVDRIPRDAEVDRAEYTSLFQTSPYVLKDSTGNLYVFRVVDSKPKHIAESVAEVREQVVEDLKLAKGMAIALARAEGLRSCSPDVSLQEAFESDAELMGMEGSGVGFAESSPVARYTTSEITSGQRNPTKYVGIGIGAVPSEIVDKWFQLEGGWERTAVYELKDRAAVMVVEWTESQPARIDQFEQQREQLATQMKTARQAQAISDWFKPDNIRARNQFKVVEQ